MNTGSKNKTKKLTLSALLCAVTVIFTMIIKIPTPTKGYINSGDVAVNISAWVLGPAYGAAASGIGSAMADALGGYVNYALATLVIKALMAVVSFYAFKFISKKVPSFPSRVIAAASAELVMVAGYTAFESFMYGSFTTAAVGLPSNIVQAVFGTAVSAALYELVIKKAEDLIK